MRPQYLVSILVALRVPRETQTLEDKNLPVATDMISVIKHERAGRSNTFNRHYIDELKFVIDVTLSQVFAI